MSLIITRNFKRAKAQDAAAMDKAPDGWWEGKTIFAAFGWGKSVKGKVVSHRGGVIKLEDGTQFKESDAYDLYAINSRAADSCGKGEDAEKFRVGQKVKHTRFGTIGKVFEIAPDGGIGVQWGNGQAYYGKFHAPLSEIVAVNE